MTGRIIPTTAPAALRNLPAWLCWRWMENPGSKPRKVPYYADGTLRGGKLGRPEDAAALVTFEQARQAALDRGMDGVGFATLRQFNVTAMDFDACVTGGQVHPEVAALVAPTYAEISPSGTGVRAFFIGQFPRNHKSNATAERPGMEIFSTSLYVTYTGQRLQGSPDQVAAITPELETAVFRRFGADQAEAKPAKNPLGLSKDQITEILAALDPPVDYEPWLQIGMSLHHETRGAAWALEAWDRYSQTAPAAYGGPDVLAAKWDSFGRGDGSAVTGRTLLRLAREAGVYVDCNGLSFDDLDAGVMRVVGCTDLETAALVPRKFWMDGILPAKALTLLGGHGGVGKSTLALAIAAHIATGAQWCGLNTIQARVLVVTLEDDADTVRWRLRAVCEAYGLPMAAVGAQLRIVDGSEVGPLMVEANQYGQRTLLDTAAMRQLRDLAKSAEVLLIDNASDAMDANENERRAVRTFVKRLQNLVAENGGAIMLLAHVAKSTAKRGEDSETYSGSTAWHNSARSRLALVADGERVRLDHQKSNFGPCIAPLFFTHQAGTLLPALAAHEPDMTLQAVLDDQHVLAALASATPPITTALQGPATSIHALTEILPGKLAGMPKRIKAALIRLEQSGQIGRVEITRAKRSREVWTVHSVHSVNSPVFGMDDRTNGPPSIPSIRTVGGVGDIARTESEPSPLVRP